MLWTAMSKNKLIQTRRSTLALTGGKPACYEQLSMESCLPQIFARNAPCGGNAPQLHVRRRVTTQHSWPTQSERQLTEETCLRILRFSKLGTFQEANTSADIRPFKLLMFGTAPIKTGKSNLSSVPGDDAVDEKGDAIATSEKKKDAVASSGQSARVVIVLRPSPG